MDEYITEITARLFGRIQVHQTEISGKTLHLFIRKVERVAEFYWKPGKLWCNDIDSVIWNSLHFILPKMFVNTMKYVSRFEIIVREVSICGFANEYMYVLKTDEKNVEEYMYLDGPLLEIMMDACGCEKGYMDTIDNGHSVKFYHYRSSK